MVARTAARVSALPRGVPRRAGGRLRHPPRRPGPPGTIECRTRRHRHASIAALLRGVGGRRRLSPRFECTTPRLCRASAMTCVSPKLLCQRQTFVQQRPRGGILAVLPQGERPDGEQHLRSRSSWPAGRCDERAASRNVAVLHGHAPAAAKGGRAVRRGGAPTPPGLAVHQRPCPTPARREGCRARVRDVPTTSPGRGRACPTPPLLPGWQSASRAACAMHRSPPRHGFQSLLGILPQRLQQTVARPGLRRIAPPRSSTSPTVGPCDRGHLLHLRVRRGVNSAKLYQQIPQVTLKARRPWRAKISRTIGGGWRRREDFFPVRALRACADGTAWRCV